MFSRMQMRFQESPPMDTPRDGWMSQAETALKSLRDIEGVVIQGRGSEIREIHIVTSSARPAKQIVRDVQTLLMARFHRVIDHRVVSVAFTEQVEHASVAAAATSPGGSATAAAAAAPEPAPAPAQAHAQAPAPPSPAPHGPAPSSPAAGVSTEPALDHRIRFRAANVFVSGPRLQAQVDFQWKGLPRTGTATGHGTRDSGHRLIALAVLHGIQDFLEEDIALSLEGVEFARVGAGDVAVVKVQLVAHREHKNLVGCCTVEQDVPQAVALATLAAVNRVLGGLPTREPTEYVLRPTSL
jgi:hypothetical protein